jgi:ABC-2 type transport system ATP-binding protein
MNDFVIETTDLSRRFGRMVAVDQLGLQAPRGSIYGFLGPNGAGKTTTIRLLLGLIRPTAGEVRLFGQPFRAALLHRVGALVETPWLYLHLTGCETLEVTRRLLGAPREGLDRALDIVKLAGDANRLVRTYSLGMRQRLGLALALLNEPELLILAISVSVDETARALEVLQRAGWAAQPHGAAQRLTVTAQQPARAAAINALLVNAGLQVFHLSLERPSLEETFLKLTDSDGRVQ